MWTPEVLPKITVCCTFAVSITSVSKHHSSLQLTRFYSQRFLYVSGLALIGYDARKIGYISIGRVV